MTLFAITHLPIIFLCTLINYIQLSIDINSEVKSQNSMLDDMGGSLGSTTEMIQSTIGKIGNMITTASSQHMYYMIVFIVFFFLVVYWFMQGNRK